MSNETQVYGKFYTSAMIYGEAKVYGEDTVVQHKTTKFSNILSGAKKIFTDLEYIVCAVIAVCVVLFCVAFHYTSEDNRGQLMTNAVNGLTTGIIIGLATSSR